MRVLVIDNTEPIDKAFNTPLIKHLSNFAVVESVNYRQVPSENKLVAHYNGIVISGAPIDYDLDVIDSRLVYMPWLTTIQIPILGICLGHQNIGRMYGSRVIINDEAEDGMEPLTIMEDDPLFEGVQSGDKITAWHTASVTLPDNFILLASTPHCHNQAMRHVEKAIYGVQFHAERSDVGIKIVNNFVALLQSKEPHHTSRG